MSDEPNVTISVKNAVFRVSLIFFTCYVSACSFLTLQLVLGSSSPSYTTSIMIPGLTFSSSVNQPIYLTWRMSELQHQPYKNGLNWAPDPQSVSRYKSLMFAIICPVFLDQLKTSFLYFDCELCITFEQNQFTI